MPGTDPHDHLSRGVPAHGGEPQADRHHPIWSMTIFRISAGVSGFGWGAHAGTATIFACVGSNAFDFFVERIFLSAFIVVSIPAFGVLLLLLRISGAEAGHALGLEVHPPHGQSTPSAHWTLPLD